MVVQFSVLGDSHIGASGSETIYRKVLKQAVRNSKFIIHGGDAIDSTTNPGEQEKIRRFQLFKTITKEYTGTYYYNIGNHDLFPYQGASDLFREHVANDFVSVVNLPGTQVKLVRLNNARGRFSLPSLSLVRMLHPSDYYIFDFHWPLYGGNLVQSFTNFDTDKIPQSHAMTREATQEFFNALRLSTLPRSHILAIFTHHAHKFVKKTCNFPNGYSNIKNFVCGCAGAHACPRPGYYQVFITRAGQNYDLFVQHIPLTR